MRVVPLALEAFLPHLLEAAAVLLLLELAVLDAILRVAMLPLVRQLAVLLLRRHVDLLRRVLGRRARRAAAPHGALEGLRHPRHHAARLPVALFMVLVVLVAAFRGRSVALDVAGSDGGRRLTRRRRDNPRHLPATRGAILLQSTTTSSRSRRQPPRRLGSAHRAAAGWVGATLILDTLLTTGIHSSRGRRAAPALYRRTRECCPGRKRPSNDRRRTFAPGPRV